MVSRLGSEPGTVHDHNITEENSKLHIETIELKQEIETNKAAMLQLVLQEDRYIQTCSML